MSSATKAPGAEGPGAYGIPGLPDRLSQSDQLRIFSAYYADRLPAEAAAELCELADEWDEQIASAPAPSDPAGAGGDLGELERLSKAATQGEATFEVVSFRVPECDDADLPGVLRIGSVEIAQVYESYGPGIDPQYEVDGAYLAALWNAHRSGQLVASTPGQKGAGEEKTGACLTAPGYSGSAPSPLVSASGEYPSRSQSGMIRRLTEEYCRVNWPSMSPAGQNYARNHMTDALRKSGFGLVALGTEAEGQDAESGLVHEGPAPQGATPAQTPPSPPSATPEGDPPMTAEEARAFLDGLSSSYMASEHYARWLRLRADDVPFPTKERDVDRQLANDIELALRTLHAAGEVR